MDTKEMWMKINDAVLTLANNKTAYMSLLPAVCAYIDGSNSYKTFRGAVFKALRQYYTPVWSNKESILTSHVAQTLFMHYYEEASGEMMTAAIPRQYYDAQPQWARAHTRGECSSFPKPGEGHDLEAEECFFTEVPLIPPEESDMVMNDKAAPGTMNIAPAVEKKVFIFGTDMRNLDIGQIANVIKDLENEIKQLSTLENKPKRVEQHIQFLRDQIATIVAALDEADTQAV